jgi:hypothetical protein
MILPGYSSAKRRSEHSMTSHNAPNKEERLQDYGSLFKLSRRTERRCCSRWDHANKHKKSSRQQRACLHGSPFLRSRSGLSIKGRASGGSPHEHAGLYQDNTFHDEPSFDTSPFVFLPKEIQRFGPHHPSGTNQPIRYGFDQHDDTALQDPDLDKKLAASPLKAPPNASAPPKSPPKGPSAASKPAAKTKR